MDIVSEEVKSLGSGKSQSIFWIKYSIPVDFLNENLIDRSLSKLTWCIVLFDDP
jgi:hypothetical protein